LAIIVVASFDATSVFNHWMEYPFTLCKTWKCSIGTLMSLILLTLMFSQQRVLEI